MGKLDESPRRMKPAAVWCMVVSVASERVAESGVRRSMSPSLSSGWRSSRPSVIGGVTLRMQEAQIRDSYEERMIGVASVATLRSSRRTTNGPSAVIQPIAGSSARPPA